MAIVACKECGHQVSDQAASCPNCGAPIAAAPGPRPPGRRIIAGVLLTFAALGLIGATLWVIGLRRVPAPLIGLIGTPAVPAGQAAPADRSAAGQRAAAELEPAPRAVYQTTAEQLNEDYDANEVATQSRIGNSRIRVTGSITEIAQDASGDPVVRLWSSGERGVALTLTGDQRAAAAQLSKGLSVDIQCDRMQRASGSPQGSGCALLLVDAGSAAAPLRARESAPAAQVSVPCTPLAPAPAAPAVSAVPASATASARTRRRAARAVHPAAADGSDTAQGALQQPLSLPAIAVAPADPATMSPFNASVPPLGVMTAAAVPQQAAPVGAGTSAAVAASPAVATSPAMALKASAAPATAARAAVAGDELATVRAADPKAAEHIVSYCAKLTAAGTRAEFAAGCRRDEVEAWTRLVLHNEFPALDDATRQKCSQAPFPDSYVAKETCARYELHVN